MSRTARYVFVAIFTFAVSIASLAAERNSLVIVFKDGHQKSYSMTDVTRMEFKNAGMLTLIRGTHHDDVPLADIARIDFSPSTSTGIQPGRNHFLGKWKVGSGAGEDFLITLTPDGKAAKTIGSPHGTWEVVAGEARISWDDGWHDVIRQVGDHHQKVAYEPGKSFDEEPNNVTDARHVDAQPI